MQDQTAMTADMIIQYSIVGIVLLAACLWIVWKLFRRQKKEADGCCGCALSENCKKKNLKK